MRYVTIRTLQDRLQDLWNRCPGRDSRARQSVRAVARRLGSVLAATEADLRRLVLSQAVYLQPREIRALALYSPPRGTLQGHGPQTLWIGDARYVPHDSPIGPQWLSGPPPHSRDGIEIRISADGAIFPSS